MNLSQSSHTSYTYSQTTPFTTPMPDNTHATNHIVCVGAVYIDTILTVPHFPIEDEKLRAQKLTRRRGGNTANTLEVLSQLLTHDPTPPNSNNNNNHPPTKLHLLTVLPAISSPATTFIRASLSPTVDISEPSIFRPAHQDPASSYILHAQESLSRTIVSINPLPDMTTDEFIASVNRIARPWTKAHFHFEGRIPSTTLSCATFLRTNFPSFTLSVECEKPERGPQIEHVARLADVVFYSKLWARGHGFESARAFLEAQRGRVRDGAVLCCTWGAGGAVAVRMGGGDEVWAEVEAWRAEGGEGEGDGDGVVDTIGAGDTFIAGMLFGVQERGDEWSLREMLEFANRLAGRKVRQEGFGGLGGMMW
ncbi:Nn.00g038960.m01.CDS01 [Neocucurbitaria sp. VM-36]